MFSSQISRALRSDPYAAECFEGVFASDKLPKKLQLYPASVVANTDPAHKPGTHWIAYYFDDQGHLDYFDSYGLPPTAYPGLSEFAAANSVTVSYNDRQIQGYDTDVCGQYCIAFIAHRSRGQSLDDIIKRYTSGGRAGAHDSRVANRVNTFYNIKRRDRVGHGQSDFKSEQCCCPKTLS